MSVFFKKSFPSFSFLGSSLFSLLSSLFSLLSSGLLLKTNLLSTKAVVAFLLCFFDVFEKGRKTTTQRDYIFFISTSSHSLCECGYNTIYTHTHHHHPSKEERKKDSPRKHHRRLKAILKKRRSKRKRNRTYNNKSF